MEGVCSLSDHVEESCFSGLDTHPGLFICKKQSSMVFRCVWYHNIACPNWYSRCPNLSASGRVTKAHSGLDGGSDRGGEGERDIQVDPAMFLAHTGG